MAGLFVEVEAASSDAIFQKYSQYLHKYPKNMQVCGNFYIYINIDFKKFAYRELICNLCGREKNNK
jgi:hypothetical protein